MNILIDECLDWRLCRALIDHQCSSVRDAGWAGVINGELLEKAQKRFERIPDWRPQFKISTERSTPSHCVIVLEASSTRLIDTLPLMPLVLTNLETIQPGQVIRINGSMP